MTLLREDCSLRIPWAFSASFQKSGWLVTWVRSSTRFCLLSTSKTPPQKLESLFQVVELLYRFSIFYHRHSFYLLK